MRTVACNSCGAKLALPWGLGESLCQCVQCGAVFAAPLREAPIAAARSQATPVLVTTRPQDPPRETTLLPQKPVVVQEKPPLNLARWAVVGLAFAVLVSISSVLGKYQLAAVEDARLGTAKVQLRWLTEVCDDYKMNNGRFPLSLQALAHQQPNGAMPLIDPLALQDPWGQPYGYDPSGPSNGGRHSDIWVNRPGGKRIGNWEVHR
jgi:hypothetical protein